MTTPTLKVEVSFASAPLATSPTWVDITDRVRNTPGLSISRGRQSEVSTFSAGSCQLLLDNRDRLFDPLNASGTYYGDLTPRRQIRVSAVWSGTTYPMFRGHVTGWPQNYPRVGTDVVVDLEAYDALAWLAETTLPNPVTSYAESVGAVRFYRVGDDVGVADVFNTAPLVYAGGVVPTTVQLAPAGTAPALVYTGVEALAGTYEFIGSSSIFSVAFWVQTTTAGVSATSWRSILSRGGTTASNYQIRIGIDNTGAVRYSGSDFIPGSRPAVSSSVSVTDGAPHYVVITQDSTGPTMYVDGVDVSASVALAPSSLSVLDVAYGSVGDVAFIGSIADIAYFDTELTLAQVQELYGLSSAFRLQSTTNRAGRVLDGVGWPSAWRSLSTTTRGECWDINYEGRSALAELQTIAATEQGRMFADKENEVTLQSRYAPLEDTRGKTVQATFSDDGADITYTNFTGFEFNDKDVANEVRVSCTYGTGTVSDATSITDYGLQTTSVSTQLLTIKLAEDMAAGLVQQRKDPKIRARPLSTVGQTQTTQWPTLLGLEIGDRIKIEITPLGVGAQVAQELIIERISWSIGSDRWELDITGSPAPTQFFLLDTSELDTGILGF
jgi:hypothetical protein